MCSFFQVYLGGRGGSIREVRRGVVQWSFARGGIVVWFCEQVVILGLGVRRLVLSFFFIYVYVDVCLRDVGVVQFRIGAWRKFYWLSLFECNGLGKNEFKFLSRAFGGLGVSMGEQQVGGLGFRNWQIQFLVINFLVLGIVMRNMVEFLLIVGIVLEQVMGYCRFQLGSFGEIGGQVRKVFCEGF